MKTISAILTAAPDGTLHLPLPEGWRNSRVKVVAQLEQVTDGTSEVSNSGCDAVRGLWEGRGTTDKMMKELRGEE